MPTKKKIKYLSTANIASLAWCHQKAKYRAIRDEELLRSEYLFLKKFGGYIAHEKNYHPLIVSKEKISSLNLLAFIRMCGYRLSFSDDFYNSDISNIEDWQELKDKFVLAKTRSNKIPEISGKFKSSLEKKYNKWKDKILKSNALGIYLPKSWMDFPWEMSSSSFRESLIKNENFYSRGIYYEIKYAEKHPTIKKLFKWKDYIVIAVPDGISKNFCYEFKSAYDKLRFAYTKPVAIAQANLYSYFYEKDRIKVQIYNIQDDFIETMYRKANREQALTLLKTMDALLKDKTKPIPPKKFKCKSCEFNKRCKIAKKLMKN